MPAEARRQPPDASSIDARLVKALSHPTRVRILHLLRHRELVSPVELSAELGLAVGTVGYHVRRLEALGFLELAKRTPRRGAVEHHYRAKAALDAVPRPPGQATVAGESTGARAFDVCRAAQDALPCGGFDPLATRSDVRLVTLDGRGRDRLAQAAGRWQATIERIARASARRLAQPGADAGLAGVAVTMAFEVDAGQD